MMSLLGSRWAARAVRGGSVTSQLHIAGRKSPACTEPPLLPSKTDRVRRALSVVPEKGTPTVKEIVLSGGQVALVDDADFEWLNQWKWSLSGKGNGVRRGICENGVWTSRLMHREIVQAAPGEPVDHINGNRLDNQRSNLRRCTTTENNRNRRQRRDSTAPYKGVVRHGGRWWARINIDGQQKWIGSFRNPEDAARAYDDAARRLYGPFARPNSL
jgi:hypothetical protein